MSWLNSIYLLLKVDLRILECNLYGRNNDLIYFVDLAFYIKCYVAMTNKQFLANQNAVGLPRHYYYQRRKTILRLDIYIYY